MAQVDIKGGVKEFAGASLSEFYHLQSRAPADVRFIICIDPSSSGYVALDLYNMNSVMLPPYVEPDAVYFYKDYDQAVAASVMRLN